MYLLIMSTVFYSYFVLSIYNFKLINRLLIYTTVFITCFKIAIFLPFHILTKIFEMQIQRVFIIKQQRVWTRWKAFEK